MKMTGRQKGKKIRIRKGKKKYSEYSEKLLHFFSEKLTSIVNVGQYEKHIVEVERNQMAWSADQQISQMYHTPSGQINYHFR